MVGRKPELSERDVSDAKAMLRMGLNREDTARVLNVSRSTLARYLDGQHKHPLREASCATSRP